MNKKTRRDPWFDFKLVGLMGLPRLSIILQAIYLTRHISEEDEAIEETIEAEKQILEDK